ncbi:MAG: NapC/NirT family cytochrome c [Coriobacteriia bacterium]|nr:NapC/NirT family cytochrome c [Coriobacteriia bacterium]
MTSDTSLIPAEEPVARLGVHRGFLRRPTRRKPVFMAMVLLGVLVVGYALQAASSSPALCLSCHEMQLRGHEWEQSAHTQVTCVDCHTKPRPWYATPLRLVDRAALIVRDVSSHLAGGYDVSIDRSSAKTSPITDAVCLQCHDPNRKATSGFRILIDHVEHAKLNGSCVSCHVRTAHPVETRGQALTFMGQCFTCHGTLEQPDASGDCGVCHPADYEPVPPTHENTKWAKKHGEIAVSDFGLCEMCHKQPFCTDCHGVAMPHPAGWAEGATGHSLVAKTNRAVCERCHGKSLDMCTMCHHQGYTPTKGTWVKQHFEQVRKRGAAYCMDRCHSPLFCIRCHAQAPQP